MAFVECSSIAGFIAENWRKLKSGLVCSKWSVVRVDFIIRRKCQRVVQVSFFRPWSPISLPHLIYHWLIWTWRKDLVKQNLCTINYCGNFFRVVSTLNHSIFFFKIAQTFFVWYNYLCTCMTESINFKKQFSSPSRSHFEKLSLHVESWKHKQHDNEEIH